MNPYYLPFFDSGAQEKSGLHPATLANPLVLEKMISGKKSNLKIGVPKEVHFQEGRVSLIPAAVGVLVMHGHQVRVENGAGVASRYSDHDYAEVGAMIAGAEEVFSESDVVVKIAPPSLDELHKMKDNALLISAIHLGSIYPEYLKLIIKKNITAIGFEFLQNNEGNMPILRMMSEIAGTASILIASELLSGFNNGKGLLLGGVTGVPPTVVTVIGAGTAGYYAIRTALGLGAQVRVIDEEIFRLRRLEEVLGQKLYTAVSQQNYVADAVAAADVVIGAVFKPGKRTPCIVSEDMVASMREGSVIVDISIDQGGCVETSEVTSHDNPTFVKHGVIHYCVPNIAARVPHTASAAISNILGPLVIRIGTAGSIQELASIDQGVKKGIYAFRRHLTHRSLSNMFNMDYIDLNLLLAAHF